MEPLLAANEALLLLTSSHLSLTYKAVRGILSCKFCILLWNTDPVYFTKEVHT